ncbi:MAG: Hsp20/alpha crystallin family protein [bacterium]
MIRSIPPKTSTGRCRTIRGDKGRTVELGQVIKIGTGERKEAASKRGEKIKPIHSWAFVSKPKFTRYYPTKKHKNVLLIERVNEPAIRILEDITETIVVAYLPQVKEKDIHIELHGDILEIAAQTKDEFGLQRYAKEILLPFIADPRAIKSSLENNILEINLRKKGRNRKR